MRGPFISEYAQYKAERCGGITTRQSVHSLTHFFPANQTA
jgi:hypothetical protein